MDFFPDKMKKYISNKKRKKEFQKPTSQGWLISSGKTVLVWVHVLTLCSSKHGKLFLKRSRKEDFPDSFNPNILTESQKYRKSCDFWQERVSFFHLHQSEIDLCWSTKKDEKAWRRCNNDLNSRTCTIIPSMHSETQTPKGDSFRNVHYYY